MASTTATISINTSTLAAIDKNAERQGKSRSQYILQWLPETHDPKPTPKSETS